MKNRFVISENDRRSILSMYGLINESLESYTFKGTVKTDISEFLELCQVIVINEKDEVVKGASTDVNGNFTLAVSLDNTKNYRIKLKHSETIEKITDILNLLEKEQTFNFVLELKAKDLEGVKIGEQVIFGKLVKVKILNEDNQPYSSGVIININTNNKNLKSGSVSKTGEMSETKKIETDKNSEAIFYVYNSKDRKDKSKYNISLNLKYGKIQFQENLEIDLNSDTTNLPTVFSRCFSNKNEKYIYYADNGDIINSLFDSTKIDKNLSDYTTIISQFIAKNKKIKEKDIEQIVCETNLLKVNFNKSIPKIRIEKLSITEIVLGNTLGVTIKVQNSSGDILPSVPVVVSYEKNGSLTDTQNTNEEGEIITQIMLLENDVKGDKTFRKRKIWVRVRKKGYDTYNNSFVVSGENNEVLITLQRTEFNPDEEENTDDFTKENTYFTFYGKSGKDVKQRYGSEFETEEAARKDALNQFLESVEKFKPYKDLLKDEIPNGGELVYRRGNETDGYYVILKFSRKYLRGFVKKVIKEKTKSKIVIYKPIVSDVRIIPTELLFNDALNKAVSEGKFLTVFYYVSQNDKVFLNSKKEFVKKLNTDSINLFINSKSDNSNTASRVLGLGSNPTIAIIENTNIVKLKQSIYGKNDLEFIINWVTTNLD
jgi:hypothetical protein